MGFIKTKGLVIKEVNTGEADRIITLFTRSHGRVSALAKGARRPKSKLAAGTQILCYSDYVLFHGKDMHSVNSCDVIEPFYEIRHDVFKLTYCAHMVDIISDTVQENQPSSKVLQLFLNSLHMLAKTDKSPELITRVFEFRLLSILGYAPYVRGCVLCGSEENDISSFSFIKCGFICDREECVSNDRFSINISVGAAKTIKHIIHSRMDELFSFNLSKDVLDELGRISKRYLRERLERDYTKLDFLKTLEI